MQPMQVLRRTLERLADAEHYLFVPADLRAVVPDLSDTAFASLLSRASDSGLLERVCRGIYLVPRVVPDPGLVVYHAAARLRAGHHLYLSCESVLSELGVISQIPLDRITLMTSGRSGEIDCGRFGVIEYIHSKRAPSAQRGQLHYDPERRLWIAAAHIAIRDLRRVGRNLDLIDDTLLQELTT